MTQPAHLSPLGVAKLNLILANSIRDLLLNQWGWIYKKKASLQNENQCMWYLIWTHMEKIAQDLAFRRVIILHDL